MTFKLYSSTCKDMYYTLRKHWEIKSLLTNKITPYSRENANCTSKPIKKLRQNQYNTESVLVNIHDPRLNKLLQLTNKYHRQVHISFKRVPDKLPCSVSHQLYCVSYTSIMHACSNNLPKHLAMMAVSLVTDWPTDGQNPKQSTSSKSFKKSCNLGKKVNI